MSKPPPIRHTKSSTIAVQLMLDTLREVCEDVATHEQALAKAREVRNEYIRAVLAAGIPQLGVSRITGLSREHLYTIKSTGEAPDPSALR